MSLLTPVWNYVDALVHPSAQQDALTAARHRAFIAPRLLGSFAALASFPVYIALRGVPSALELGVFGWLVAPILIAYFLSRTGRYEAAHVMSSFSLTGLVAVVAWCTGGIGSFAAIWLVVVPLEAALSASRRVVALAASFALAAAGLLLSLSALDLQPPANVLANAHGALAALAIISAALYATGLALGAEQLTRTSTGLLNAEEERYRLLARNMTDVITRHGRNGTVLFVSPAAEPLFGVRASGLAGHGLFDRVHVADRPAFLTALADAAALGEDRSVEFRIRRNNDAEPHGGHFAWIEMRCRPLALATDAANSPEREVVAVLRDVTERRVQERALEIARKESERINSAKSRFLATMSHELRTPLNAIIGFSDVIQATNSDASAHAEYAEHISKAGRRMLSVVSDILDMSKLEGGTLTLSLQPCSLNDVIDASVDAVQADAEAKSQTLDVRVNGELPLLAIDYKRIKQIMLNLLSNAIKFTPDKGSIVLSAEPSPNGGAILTVTDTGAGMSAEQTATALRPFGQVQSYLSRTQEGAGLGLPIALGLAQIHGGSLHLDSEPGVGTRAILTLPPSKRSVS